MPCTFRKQTTEIQKQNALADLEERLRRGEVKALFDARGNLTRFQNWKTENRQGWCDGCACRALQRRKSKILQDLQRKSKTQVRVG